MLIELPSLEVCILQLRYGLLDGQAYTPEDVARKIGVTTEDARQIEAQAMSRFMANWTIVLEALHDLWEIEKTSQLKSPFYKRLGKPKTV